MKTAENNPYKKLAIQWYPYLFLLDTKVLRKFYHWPSYIWHWFLIYLLFVSITLRLIEFFYIDKIIITNIENIFFRKCNSLDLDYFNFKTVAQNSF